MKEKKTLYIETKMGAAGDMLMSAFYELLPPERQQLFLDKMNALFPDTITVSPESVVKSGIFGTHMQVLVRGEEEDAPHHTHEHNHSREHNHNHEHFHVHDSNFEHRHEHEHSHDHDSNFEHGHEHAHEHKHHVHEHYSYRDILSRIADLDLPDDVKADAAAVYRMIGEAEAHVHNTGLEHIHFHEVGSLDAICDVVGVSLALHYLNPAEIICSPIHVGNGVVHCAHGVLPVPAPATAEILKNIPYYTGQIDSELCTPTGAALLKHFTTAFGAMPTMNIEKTGFGMGKKDFPIANTVRTFLGNRWDDTHEPPKFASLAAEVQSGSVCNQIADLSCNLDDITGEALGYTMEKLMAEGALDVFYIPIQMKKNRPGILLHTLCEVSEIETFVRLILEHTTTRGVRYQLHHRAKLSTAFSELTVDGLSIRKKISEGYGVHREKLEFEDIKKYAEEKNISLSSAQEVLTRLFL